MANSGEKLRGTHPSVSPSPSSLPLCSLPYRRRAAHLLRRSTGAAPSTPAPPRGRPPRHRPAADARPSSPPSPRSRPSPASWTEAAVGAVATRYAARVAALHRRRCVLYPSTELPAWMDCKSTFPSSMRRRRSVPSHREHLAPVATPGRRWHVRRVDHRDDTYLQHGRAACSELWGLGERPRRQPPSSARDGWCRRGAMKARHRRGGAAWSREAPVERWRRWRARGDGQRTRKERREERRGWVPRVFTSLPRCTAWAKVANS